ncbi:MAG: zinc ribbon domain-containing protein [Thermoplasmata archaeon]
MRCLVCGTHNPDGKRYCGRCGNDMSAKMVPGPVVSAPRCPVCGTYNPEGKKFCGQCGGELPLLQSYEPAPTTVRCWNCGADNLYGKSYCGDCGSDLNRHVDSPTEEVLSEPAEPLASGGGRVRTGYLVVGGLIASIFSGLFYWGYTYTYEEEVWHDLGYGFGYWETVTRTLDSAIPASFLVVALIGVICMIYGAVSRK